MRLSTPGAPHLTYCTNIHPGESWAEVRQNLERYTLAVKQEISPDAPFGLGLRLSARAAAALSQPAELEELRSFLAESDLYFFTFNGFPYGPFHGEPVKEEVYLPDWADEARLVYTNQLADILAALLPPDPEVQGSISTVPGAFRPRVRTRAEAEAIGMMIARHAAHLYRLREETGREISLALEPEPFCYIELAKEAIRFIRDQVWSRAPRAAFASLTGVKGDAGEEFLRNHVGVCIDTCHMAVEYEGCEEAVRALQEAEIRILKAQVTAGMQVEFDGSSRDQEKLSALRSFADAVYLHQVVARRGGELRRYLDLPAALAEWEQGRLPEECRIHFHVPVFREELGPFVGTQSYVAEFLDLVRSEPVTPHLEVETYTWNVLPESYRREGLVHGIAGELRWVLEQVGR